MKIFLLSIMKDKKIRIRFLILIILLIYIPMILNIFINYKSTMSIITKERIESSNQVLYKTTQSIDYNIDNLKKDINEIANDNGYNASLYQYDKVEEKYQKRVDSYLQEKLNEVKNENYFIDHLIYVTYNDKFFSNEEEHKIIEDEFLKSKVYREFLKDERDQIWIYNDDETSYLKDDYEESLIVFQKLNYMIPKAMAEKHNVQEKDRNFHAGILVTIVNIDALNSLYKDILVNDIYDISIFNDKGEVLFNNKEDLNLSSEVKDSIDKGINIETKEIDYNNKKVLLSISKIESIDGWYLSTIQSMDSIIGETKESLRESFLMLGFVGLIISLWIILELLVFSKLMTEKEVSNYRLEVTEDMNSKLRIYKHDFFNHLQIIQGLLEMKQSDKALNYLQDVVKEGRLLTSRYKIGIPEIEATIYSAINKAKKVGINVEIDFIELPKNININLYDLSKILTNLLKNAVQALEVSGFDNKVLKIEIYESVGDYVFSVYNNKPIIKEEIRDNIFEKDFSTNGDKNRGLGLYIVKSLVEKNNGSLDLIIDDGNYFIVRFPKN
ncbi:Spo0B domain-containing protein [Clostridium sp. D2Q-14]|uniref:Spo0B domain-containing protein n=1 Tax=Anaeromonas gelatinilytica TaxID=2683194 RepID=UPI00193B536C|nr:ATP-binding protein [Anaeromonas gelatinilytica]MBS4535382.1 Spo0B domain-containing protein [Anaeromonas gelatinilytica]